MPKGPHLLPYKGINDVTQFWQWHTMLHVTLMFLSEWRKFHLRVALQVKKNWLQVATWCWNHARRLTWSLSASLIRKYLKFGTWTDPSFQPHCCTSTDI
jgi:hypothetical protein